MLSLRLLRVTPQRLQRMARSTHSPGCASPQEFKVTLDNETLYIDQQLAEALGWKQAEGTKSVSLNLSGCSPHYFAITRAGTDSDLLARGTVESFANPRVQHLLRYLKDR